MIVGSGSPVGPNGPKNAAQEATASTRTPANTMSLRKATGTKGTPSSRTSSSYSASYVSRRTSRPGIGHSLMPSFRTMQQVKPDETDQQTRHDEDVQGEEARSASRPR